MRKSILLFWALVLSAVPFAAAAEDEPVVIVVQPTATPEQLSANAEELDRFLEARLQRAVEIRFPTNYAGAIEALHFGHAQAGFMSAWPAALAHEKAGAEVALAEVREVTIGQERKEAPYYYSYWVVLPGSPVTSLEQLRGKRVAFSSPLSTSGYIAPLARLVELGLVAAGKNAVADPKSFFSEVLFAGGYAQGWAALKAGQVDATIIAGDVPEVLYREVLENTRIIEQQGPIPSHAVVIAKETPQPLKQQLIDALLALNEPAHQPLMRKFISGIFVRFEPTTTTEHLGSLQRFLDLTDAAFAEKP